MLEQRKESVCPLERTEEGEVGAGRQRDIQRSRSRNIDVSADIARLRVVARRIFAPLKLLLRH